MFNGVTSDGWPCAALPCAAGAEGTIDQDWEHYTLEEHATWKTLYERQSQLLQGRACDEFLDGLHDLPMNAGIIPDFRRLSEVLMRRTGWQIVAVPGLVPAAAFFDHLAKRRFPAGNFIRKPHQLNYLEEPDVFHDVFGHVPMLLNPAIANFMQAYGVCGLRAQQLGHLHHLSRIYWHTVEFGLVRQAQGLRLYGAGIASSYAETEFALDGASVHRVRFELSRVMRTRYRIDDLQQCYFVIDRLSDLLKLGQMDFEPIYKSLLGQAELDPGQLTPEDIVLPVG